MLELLKSLVFAVIMVPVVMAIILGAIAGAICVYAVGLKDRFGYDDSLDVVGVNLVGGVVGTLLIAEAFEVHVPKGYVYFAMAFSLGVEALNIRMRVLRGRKEDPVKLRKDIPGQ